jgi:hypothetical protein
MSHWVSIIGLALLLLVPGGTPAIAQLGEPSLEQTQAFIHSQSCPTGEKAVPNRHAKQSAHGKKDLCQPTPTVDETLHPTHQRYHTRAHGQLYTGIDTSDITSDRIHSGTGKHYVKHNTPKGTSGDDRSAGNQLRGSNAGHYVDSHFLT